MPNISNKSRIKPPWPKPLPYTANIFQRLARGWKSWLDLLNEWDFRIPIGELNLLGLPVFLVNEPQLVREILVEDVDNFPKHPYTLWILEPLIGRAIFSVNGDEWAWQRRLIDQAFQVAKLKRVFPAMAEATKSLIERLTKYGSEYPIDIDKEMTLVTADVITRTILSRPLEEGEAKEIFEAFARYQRRAGRALVMRFLHLPRGLVQLSLRRDAKIIRKWIKSAIEERLKYQSKNVAKSSSNPSDILDCLIMAHDQESDRKFTLEELVDQVCFLFLAGHETSASSLGIATWLLAISPAVQDKLREEVHQVTSKQSLDESIGPNELKKLNYCSAVFNETLRLYPPVSFFIRERTESETLLKTPNQTSKCPVGALLTLSPWVIQRHEKHWQSPEEFQPERFLEEKETKWFREAFLPFGMGPRKCPGAAFAQQEAVLVLAELVRRFKVLPVKGHTPNLIGRLTLRSANGIRLRLPLLDS